MTLDYFYGQTGELFSFYRIPKALFQEQRFQSLSTDAKTLYGILLDRMSLSYLPASGKSSQADGADLKGLSLFQYLLPVIQEVLYVEDQ